MTVHHIQNDPVDTNDLDGIILTSANAVHALGDIKGYNGLIYTVGDQTADIVKAKGFFECGFSIGNSS